MPLPLAITFGIWTKLRHLGAIGQVLLGIADASVIPTPGSLDALTIVLVAHNPRLWWFYAIAAAVGSTLGAALTYHLGAKGGKAGFERRFPKDKVQRVYGWSEKYGAGAVLVPALLPPPFPLSPFLIAAGALKVRFVSFLLSFFAGRLVRFGIVAALSMIYGRALLHFMSRYSRPITIFLIVLAVVGAMIGVAYIIRRKQKGLPALRSAEKRAA